LLERCEWSFGELTLRMRWFVDAGTVEPIGPDLGSCWRYEAPSVPTSKSNNTTFIEKPFQTGSGFP
jgi:hypothetical protein